MLTRKRQLLRKVEVTEGTAVALSTADYVRGLDVSTTTTPDIEDRVTSGASISEDAGVVGRVPFQIRYGLDLYPLGGTIEPLAAVDMKASGLKAATNRYLTVSSWPTPGPTWAGQQLTDGLGGTATLAIPVGTSLRVYYRNAAGGFPGDTTISTTTSGTITLASTTPVTADTGYVYTPTSTPSAWVSINNIAWGGTGTTPVPGEVVSNGLDGDQAARAVVISVGTVLVEVQPVIHFAPFLVGQTMTGLTGGGTQPVVAPGQVLANVPSITIRDNVDGWHRTGAGCRGTGEIVLEAGKVPRMNFDMQGQLSSHGDTPLLTGVTDTALGLIPRWQSATCSLDGFEIPQSRWTLSMANNVALTADAHGANGIRGGAITSRQPSLSIDPDQVPAAVLNYLTRMTAGSTVSAFTMWGTTLGLRTAIHVPKGQLYSRDDEDADGVLKANINLRCKRDSADGDNEIYIYFGI